jgi:RNA polymerase sigma factor (sigma-70 family)
MTWDDLPDLLRRARNADEDAWQALVELGQPFLLGQVAKAIGPRWPQQSASDLTQETWQRAWTNLHDFRGGPTAADTGAMFRAWLAKILQSQWKNSVRAMLAKKRVAGDAIVPLTGGCAAGAEPADPGPAPSVEVRRREQAAEAIEALAGLEDPRDRDVLRLYFYDSLSFREIAAELQISLDKVRTSYHRGLERLQDLKRLQNLMDSLP